MISHRNQGPRIDITVGEIRVQLSAMEARDLVGNIQQCIAAAESDALIDLQIRAFRDQALQS